MKLVCFDNGTYGVKIIGILSLFFPKFLDLKNTQFTWFFGDAYFKDCQGTKEEALKAMKRKRKPGYTVVKEQN